MRFRCDDYSGIPSFMDSLNGAMQSIEVRGVIRIEPNHMPKMAMPVPSRQKR
jgi:hypothetical protein